MSKLFNAVLNGQQPVMTKFILKNIAETEGLEYLRAALSEKEVAADKFRRQDFTGTAFQAALCAEDIKMCEAIKECFALLPDGQQLMEEQFNEIFPLARGGLQAHLEAQKRNTFDFTAILKAIEDATLEELQAALENPNNGSPLCRALNDFRAAFIQHSLNEKVFNPHHVLRALEIYGAHYYDWCNIPGKRDSGHKRHSVFWRQVVGFTQDVLPADYRKDFEQGIRKTVVANENGLQQSFDSVSDSPATGLGVDYAFWPTSGDRATIIAPSARSGEWTTHGPLCFKTYIEQKQLGLENVVTQPTVQPVTTMHHIADDLYFKIEKTERTPFKSESYNVSVIINDNGTEIQKARIVLREESGRNLIREIGKPVPSFKDIFLNELYGDTPSNIFRLISEAQRREMSKQTASMIDASRAQTASQRAERTVAETATRQLTRPVTQPATQAQPVATLYPVVGDLSFKITGFGDAMHKLTVIVNDKEAPGCGMLTHSVEKIISKIGNLQELKEFFDDGGSTSSQILEKIKEAEKRAAQQPANSASPAGMFDASRTRAAAQRVEENTRPRLTGPALPIALD